MVCSFLEGEPYARTLNEMGFHAFVVYYRVKKKAAYPAPQDDLARAIREILNHKEVWNLDADNYSLWGSSAGGHLAASFCTNAMGYKNDGLPQPSTLILAYPVVTMDQKLTHIGTRKNLIGTAPTDEIVYLASIENHIAKDFPRTFLWCGSADSLVPPENSRMLAARLKANGVPHCFIEYPGVDHGVGLGKGLACEGWIKEAVRFWQLK